MTQLCICCGWRAKLSSNWRRVLLIFSKILLFSDVRWRGNANWITNDNHRGLCRIRIIASPWVVPLNCRTHSRLSTTSLSVQNLARQRSFMARCHNAVSSHGLSIIAHSIGPFRWSCLVRETISCLLYLLCLDLIQIYAQRSHRRPLAAKCWASDTAGEEDAARAAVCWAVGRDAEYNRHNQFTIWRQNSTQKTCSHAPRNRLCYCTGKLELSSMDTQVERTRPLYVYKIYQIHQVYQVYRNYTAAEV